MSSYQDRRPLMHGNSLGSLTVTGTNETAKDIAPSALSIPLLQAKNLSGNYSVAEVWVPVGIWYVVTTINAAAGAVVTLRKNGVSAATGGTATISTAAATANWLFAPFSAYTFAAADAAADAWSVLVTTVASSTGVINPVVLCYAIRAVGNVTDTTL